MNSEKSPYGSRLQRLLFFILGSVFVALATPGVLLPLLPTTPFLLLRSGLLRALFESFSQLAASQQNLWSDDSSVAGKSQHCPANKGHSDRYARGYTGLICGILCAAVAD